MKARDTTKIGALRLLRAAFQNFEVARTDAKHPQHGQPIGEGDYVAIVQREIKQRQDSIEAFTKGNRADLVATEQSEIDVISAYLPKQLERGAIEEHVLGLVAELGKDFKAVMPRAARELRGRADGRIVNEVVRELTG